MKLKQLIIPIIAGLFIASMAGAITFIAEWQGGTGRGTYTAGDILYSDATDSLTVLNKGSDDEVLKLASGIPSWATVASIVGDIYINEAGDTTGAMTSDLNLDANTLVVDYDTNEVGIGIADPLARLHVYYPTSGNLIFQAQAGDGSGDLQIKYGYNGFGFYYEYEGSGSGDNNEWQLWTEGSGDVDKEVYDIKQSGNIRFKQIVGMVSSKDSSNVAYIQNTDTAIGTAGYLLKLIHDSDNDADADFLVCQDDGAGTPDTVFSIASDGTTVVGSSGTSIFTDSLSIGGLTAGTADMGAGNSADLFVSDDLEVNGKVYAEGNLSISNAAASAGVLTLLEDTDAGANYASFQVPALAANTVYTLPPDDGDNTEVLQTDGSGTLTWVANAGGGATAWDDITNPDADDTITLAGYEIGFTSTLDEAAHSVLTIANTDADLVAETFLFTLKYVDDGQANAVFMQCIDDTGVTPNQVFKIGADGSIALDGTITTPSSVYVNLLGLKGTGGVSDGQILMTSDDLYIQNTLTNKDMIFRVSEGGSTRSITWDADVDKLKHSEGLFDFDNDNLTTTGNMTATGFTGALTGNASTATALAANPTDCGANTFATTIAANGNLTCAAVASSYITDGTIAEADLDIANAAVDEYVLSYEADTSNFQWVSVAGGGDVTDVFDCSTGDCNTLTVGTSEWLVYGTGFIDANRFAGVTTVDGTEFGHLNGVTGAIQTQFAGKQGTLTNSAGLLAALNDETGSGLAVFSTSPTFTTGITVPADSISHTELSEGDAFVFTGSVALPQGAPTIDGAGEIGIDTSSDQLVYYGAAKRVITYWREMCFTLEDAADADDNVPIWSPKDNITITDVYCRTQGGTSTVVTISDGTNALEAITCDADGQADDGSIANGTFTANERMEFDIGTVTGSVDWTNVCITYTIDAD